MPKLPALPYIRGAVSEGLSGNEAYRQFQAAAREASAQTGERYTTIRQSVFRQIYSETVAGRARIADALTAPKDSPGGGLTPVTRSTVRATGYGNWVSLFHRAVGSSEVERFYYLAKSKEPLTPAEAEALAISDFEDAAQQEHGTVTNHVVEGAIFTGVEQYVPTEGA